MKYRRRLSLRKSRKLAKRTANRTRRANLIRRVSRGGIKF